MLVFVEDPAKSIMSMYAQAREVGWLSHRVG
jgi:hypothetical protein